MTTQMAQAARMEWIKLRSLRSTWWLLATTMVAMVAVGAGVGLGYRSHTPVASAAQIVNNALGGAVLAQLLIGALGVLMVTGEHSSGLARATYAAVPHRGRVLAAKVATFGPIACVVGQLAAFAAFVAGQLAIAGSPVPHASLADPAVLRATVLTGLCLSLIGFLGVAIGTVVRHPGGAIGVLFGVLFVPMLLAGVFGPAGIKVLRFVPLSILINSVAVLTPVPGTLTAWAGLAVIGLYAAVALALGWWLLVRRDV
jgi:ABC-type transport system involved in multi-copper enzyme maturation permease subunit